MLKTPLSQRPDSDPANKVPIHYFIVIKRMALLISTLALLNGCAVVTTAALVGGVAVSATTTALDLTYEASKAVATGTYTVGEFAVDAMEKPEPTAVPNSSTPLSNHLEID